MKYFASFNKKFGERGGLERHKAGGLGDVRKTCGERVLAGGPSFVPTGPVLTPGEKLQWPLDHLGRGGQREPGRRMTGARHERRATGGGKQRPHTQNSTALWYLRPTNRAHLPYMWVMRAGWGSRAEVLRTHPSFPC